MSVIFAPISVFINKWTSMWQWGIPESKSGSKVLLVHCHPCTESYSEAVANSVQRGLRGAGHEVRSLSLYANTLSASSAKQLLPPGNPPMTKAISNQERSNYYEIAKPDVDGKCTNSGLDPEIANAVTLLRWCDALVFVYPTWWFNVPGALKSFFDRTLLPHVAFSLPPADLQSEREGPSTTSTGLVPLLTNIKKVGVVTTYGAPKPVALLAGDNGRQMISRAIRPLFNKECPMVWMGLYNIHGSSLKERQSFLSNVENRFRRF